MVISGELSVQRSVFVRALLTGLKRAGPQLEKGDVMYFCAPIRIQQHLTQGLMLFLGCLSVKLVINNTLDVLTLIAAFLFMNI